MAKAKSSTDPKKKPAKKVADLSAPLSCVLTPEEYVDRSQKLAIALSDREDHEHHVKAVKEDLKAKESALASRISNLGGVVRNKAEIRDVPVERWQHFDIGVVREIRTDTGEVISERPLRMEERQELMQLERNAEVDRIEVAANAHLRAAGLNPETGEPADDSDDASTD